MVYPRSDGSRSLAKFVAVCAVNLCLLHSSVLAKAHKQASVVATSCTTVVSPGDADVGIKIVTDASCASGGVGCIDSICRFCQTKETPQSAHLTGCDTIGWTPAPTTSVPTTAGPVVTVAPASSSTGPCAVAQSDYDAGVTAIVDASCKTGGLGCFSDTCRHCKWKVTDNSGHLKPCDSYQASGTAADSTSAPADPATSSPATAAPVATQPPTPDDSDTGCPYAVSDGDYAVGIHLVGDASCVAGGTGCFQDICRYCKYRETPQASHLMACTDLGYPFSDGPAPTFAPVDTGDDEDPVPATDAPTTEAPDTETPATDAPATNGPDADPTTDAAAPEPTTAAPDASSGSADTETGCPYAISEGDKAVGIQLVGDVSCVVGGVGCYQDICRYCQVRKTPQSGHLTLCGELGYDFGSGGGGDYPTGDPSTDAPTEDPTTEDPSTEDPSTEDPTTEDPTTEDPTDPATGCPWAVTEGDHAVGIQLVGDSSCASGGVGCFKDVCRYCKYSETPQSKHLIACADIGYWFTESPTFAPVDTGDDETPIDAPTDAPTEEPTVDPSTGCAHAVTDGDKAVGIELVGDSTCANGGVGCFQDVCRYCQVWKTAQSGHLTRCSDLGYDFGSGGGGTEDPTTDEPTETPTADPATGCPWAVTDGDHAVGIQLVGDSSCANGGVGCFKDVCRYCKYSETPQSKHLLSCSTLGYSFTEAPTEEPTFAPVDTGDDETPTSAPTVDPTTGCAYAVTDGDKAVGIELVGDSTCANGGVGCFQDVCRYCQVWKTAQSGHLTLCADLGYDFGSGGGGTEDPTTDEPTETPTADPATGCPWAVTDGDYAVGIQLVGDSSCANGGVGCFKDVCRYCKVRDTAQSKHMVPCSDLGYPHTEAPTEEPTFAPVDIGGSNDDETPATPEPTTEVPDIYDGSNDGDADTTTPAPTVIIVIETPEPSTESPAIDPSTGCAYAVTDGDKAVGIELVGDSTCANGGVGCFQDVCRYCQVWKTAQSGHLTRCSDLGYDFGSGGGGTEDPTTDEPTETPTVDPATGCPWAVTEGDYAVGIQLVGDSSCANGGVGCFKDVCRYCKLHDTPQSKHMVPCSDLGYPHTEAPTEEPTFAPVDTGDDETPTSAPTVDPTTGCAYAVTDGDKAVGIQLVGDSTCANGGVGCFQDVCRYCQVWKTAQSGHLTPCSELGYDFGSGGSGTEDPTTDGPTGTPSTDPLPTTCPLSVSEGDYAVGIQLVTDPSCVNGGLGCLAETCRFCKFRETPQSSHLQDCSSYTASTSAPATDAPDAETPAPTSEDPIGDPTDTGDCSYSASEGDQLVGIQMIGDATCVDGGVGCVHDVCRYCKFFDSPNSAHLDDCSKYGYNFDTSAPEPATTTEAPPPSSDDPVCQTTTTEGDLKVGIDTVTDASCLSGGVGCLGETVCRQCKRFETSSSKHLEWCAVITGDVDEPSSSPSTDAPTDAPWTDAPEDPVDTPSTTTEAPSPSDWEPCDQTSSPGDLNVGIDVVTDASCLSGGVGCLGETVCRQCKRFETSNSKHLVWCSSISTDVDTPTDAPWTDEPATDAPWTDAPEDPTDTAEPTETPAPADYGECTDSVSDGDLAVGIDMVTDASCLSGGVGCVSPDSVCRQCKRFETGNSKHLVWCSSITGDADGDAPTDAPSTDEPVTDAPWTDAPEEPTETPAPADYGECTDSVSDGDLAVGIDMVTDASCLSGGVGCVSPDSVCRQCKRFETGNSKHLVWCSSITGDADGDAPTDAPWTDEPVTDEPWTDAPEEPTETPAPADYGECSEGATDGDLAVGIDVITDVSCLSGGVGCISPDSVCRQCKRWETTLSERLEWCGKILGSSDAYTNPPTSDETPSDETPTDETPAPTMDPLECSTEVSPGDADAGIAAVHDENCLSKDQDGLGCFGGVCRFCKVFDSAASSHLLDCESFYPTIRPLRAAAKLKTNANAKVEAKKANGKKADAKKTDAKKADHKKTDVKAQKKAPSLKSNIKSTKSTSLSASTTMKSRLDELFKDTTFKWSVMAAACVGVVAVVALAAFGAKRVVKRRRSRHQSIEEATPAEDEAAPSTIELEEDASEVHV